MPCLALPLIFSILAQLSVAHAGSPAQHDRPDLAHEDIKVKTRYTDNATVTAWQETEICSDEYCVFANKEVANGRGIVMVTTDADTQLLEAIENQLNKHGNLNAQPPSISAKDVSGKGVSYVAEENLRRGTQLMALTPVLLVHHDFFKEVSGKEQNRVLEAAVQLLPDSTREKFNSQRNYAGRVRNITEIMAANPFLTALEFSPRFRLDDPDKHYANYPEVSTFVHDCRPNFAWHISNNLILRTTVARRISPGEELTITHLSPLLPRANRQQQSRNLHGYPCSCATCTGSGGNLEGMVKSDERLQEISDLTEQLKDFRSEGVTTATVARFLELYEQERLHVKMAEAYWEAGLNYNYLGYQKEAVKYTNRAIQAGIIEWGPGANDIIAMQIFLKNPTDHYSWKARLRRNK